MSEAARRVVGLVVLAVLVAAGCTVAGLWQWQRGDEREQAVATLRTNYTAEPVPLDELLAAPDAALPEALTWRPVAVTGRYVPGSTVLLRNRPVDGKPAFHVLAALEVDEPGSPFDGALLVIDRGWVPIGTDATGELDVAAPPEGTVTVEARVRPAESRSSRTAPAGQVHTIHPEQVLAASGTTGSFVARAYGGLVAETPAPDVVLGPLPVPSTDLGPHRSYAMQWWMFALGALVGFGILAWRERRDDDATQTRAHAVREPRRRRRPSAEDEEDALIEAQASETSSR